MNILNHCGDDVLSGSVSHAGCTCDTSIAWYCFAPFPNWHVQWCVMNTMSCLSVLLSVISVRNTDGRSLFSTDHANVHVAERHFEGCQGCHRSCEYDYCCAPKIVSLAVCFIYVSFAATFLKQCMVFGAFDFAYFSQTRRPIRLLTLAESS